MNDLVAPLSSKAFFIALSFLVYSEIEALIALFHATYTKSVLHAQTRATLLRRLENPLLLPQSVIDLTNEDSSSDDEEL